MARARVLRAHADSQRLSAGLGHGSCFGRGDRRRLLWNSHQRSVCGKPYLFTERRRTVPVIGEEKFLQPRVAVEGYSKHLKGLPFKILNPGPNRDQRDRFRSVSRKILLESQDQVSRLPVLKRRCKISKVSRSKFSTPGQTGTSETAFGAFLGRFSLRAKTRSLVSLFSRDDV